MRGITMALAFLFLIATVGPGCGSSSSAATLTVYKSPTCGCCSKWIGHLEANGFAVEAIDLRDVNPVKRENKARLGLIQIEILLPHGIPEVLVEHLGKPKPVPAGPQTLEPKPTIRASPGHRTPRTPPVSIVLRSILRLRPHL